MGTWTWYVNIDQHRAAEIEAEPFPTRWLPHGLKSGPPSMSLRDIPKRKKTFEVGLAIPKRQTMSRNNCRLPNALHLLVTEKEKGLGRGSFICRTQASRFLHSRKQCLMFIQAWTHTTYKWYQMIWDKTLFYKMYNNLLFIIIDDI